MADSTVDQPECIERLTVRLTMRDWLNQVRQLEPINTEAESGPALVAAARYEDDPIISGHPAAPPPP